ncbi:MerR family DNA-binding transcriptional regulator [Actinomadura rifamycini]|uniref:MerR family DNA-binding transcriptional regulator n=1 Tax=Actinomadura rifamycini TaxID=31962 RepID=UPI0004064EC7|nr:MerR family transcriptional regulator [Actinomadura rifamycini]
MLSIGEFANMTGLSVKALRHYDEKGVLSPAEVDAATGYRRYSEGQVRSGALVRAMRDAGLPLPAVAAAVRDGDAASALDEHRQRVLADRAREDAAFENARLVVSSFAAPVEVTERESPARPYVARALAVRTDGDHETDDEAANDLLMGLLADLRSDGLGPSGQFWTAVREGDAPDRAEVVCCWPTAEPAPDGWGGPGTVVGVLPERRELVATWRSATGGPLPEGSVHPAVVALFDAVAARGVAVSHDEVRQAVLGRDEHDHSVEVSVTIEQP